MKTQRLVTVIVAAFILALSVGNASANKLSFSNRFFRINWTSLTFVGGGFEVECNVTFEGSFHSSTITKTVGNLIGYITRAKAGSCEGAGNIVVLNGTEVLLGRVVANTLPWHMTYTGFIGRLPRLEAFLARIHGASGLVEIFGFNCLYRSTVMEPMRVAFLINGEGRVYSLQAIEEPIPLNEGEIFCPRTITPVGLAGVQLLGQVTSIFITLI